MAMTVLSILANRKFSLNSSNQNTDRHCNLGTKKPNLNLRITDKQKALFGGLFKAHRAGTHDLTICTSKPNGHKLPRT